MSKFFFIGLIRLLTYPNLISYNLGQLEFIKYRLAAFPIAFNLGADGTLLVLKILSIRIDPSLLSPSTYRVSSDTITCMWKPSQSNNQLCFFMLELAANGQEIESQYINNASAYTRAIQYLNGDIAHDVYLHLPGRLDSLEANSATYLHQYGMTGRSTVLFTFPLSEKRLRRGCRVSFRSVLFDLPFRQFVFSTSALKQARRKAAATH